MADVPAVLYERRPPWAWLRLNRPAVHNAYDTAMRDGLWEALAATAADPDVAGVVVAGEGPSFGTGGDLREFGLAPQPWRNQRIRRERDVWGRLWRHRCLTVALLHGHVAGSGLELALYCDLRLCTPDSRWALPETGAGLIPGAGGTQTLPRLARPGRAVDMMLRGRAIDGATAHRWGLAQAVIGEAPFREAAARWLRERVEPLLDAPADAPPAALRLKRLLRRSQGLPLAEGLRLERDAAAVAAGV